MSFSFFYFLLWNYDFSHYWNLKNRTKGKKEFNRFKYQGIKKTLLDADDKLFSTLVRLDRVKLNYVLENARARISSGRHRKEKTKEYL